uniref:Uncharacterized protein n=1 Tax=Rhizophora mucronata TaxID=61149 RepID=A0A2P2QQC3_RHIMU
MFSGAYPLKREKKRERNNRTKHTSYM